MIFIPEGKVDVLWECAANYPFVDNKTKAFIKYARVVSYAVERFRASRDGYVNISYSTMKKKLGVDNVALSYILEDLINVGLLVPSDENTIERRYRREAFTYRPVFIRVEFLLFQRDLLDKKDDFILEGFSLSTKCKRTLEYFQVVKRVTVSEDIFQYLREMYPEYDSILTFRDRYISKTISYLRESAQDNLVPNVQRGRFEKDNSVPYHNMGVVPAELIHLFKLMGGKYTISRPILDTRVYTNLTNLRRDFRPFLLIDGKPLRFGFDVANCQPLLAVPDFMEFSMLKYGHLVADVMRYKGRCETGTFYKFFMDILSMDESDEDAKGDFKKDFFGGVFYSRNSPKENTHKNMFRAEYPTCYEAMFELKGGRNGSMGYKNFPHKMTKRETEIMLETNFELVSMGYNVVNVFDSLYSDSREAIELAKGIVMEKFARYGITPKLKDIDYGADSPTESYGLQHRDETENQYERSGVGTEDEIEALMRKLKLPKEQGNNKTNFMANSEKEIKSVISELEEEKCVSQCKTIIDPVIIP